jgi:hypothetical protein
MTYDYFLTTTPMQHTDASTLADPSTDAARISYVGPMRPDGMAGRVRTAWLYTAPSKIVATSTTIGTGGAVIVTTWWRRPYDPASAWVEGKPWPDAWAGHALPAESWALSWVGVAS